MSELRKNIFSHSNNSLCSNNKTKHQNVASLKATVCTDFPIYDISVQYNRRRSESAWAKIGAGQNRAENT